MGFSSIAKTPVSHGVEPHDLETVRTFAFVFSSLKLPASPRRNYRASGFVLTSIRDMLKRLKRANSGRSPTPAANGSNRPFVVLQDWVY
jgi:hypothetical protein